MSDDTVRTSRLPFPARYLRIWRWIPLICAALYVFSYTNPLVRLMYVGTALFGLFTGMLYLPRLFARVPSTRYFLLLMLALFLAWAMLAGRPPDTAHLRAQYVARLRAYCGVHYIWGGETHVGIDCSGLARTALWEALLLEGIREGNPRLLGPATWLYWWRDMSAKAMAEGAWGYTHDIFGGPRKDDFNTLPLQPGDMAVANGGSHVLIYLGGRDWIEANPAEGRVALTTANAHRVGGWQGFPITFVRWWVLEDGEPLGPRARSGPGNYTRVVNCIEISGACLKLLCTRQASTVFMKAS